MDFLREPLRAGWERFGAQSRGLAALACLEGNTHRSTWELGLAATPNNRDNRSEPFSSLKEVIQPHLPVQLPCYDFVPVTKPDLGACLPCGLAQRLQSFSASMT